MAWVKIVGLFGGTLNAMTTANVPPNLPTITWAATLDPGYHSFSKWAIDLLKFNLVSSSPGVSNIPYELIQGQNI